MFYVESIDDNTIMLYPKGQDGEGQEVRVNLDGSFYLLYYNRSFYDLESIVNFLKEIKGNENG